MDTLSRILSIVEEPVESGGFKIENAHFENGKNLHSSQYYFARKFFNNSTNSSLLAELLKERLKDLRDTTLIGFRNYLGMTLLNATKESQELDFALVEESKNEYVWHDRKEFRKNLVVVLPISCSFSGYFKIRKFLEKTIQSDNLTGVTVSDSFFSLFTIFDKKLEADFGDNSEVELESVEPACKERFESFRWLKASKAFVSIAAEENTTITASVAVPLFADYWLPDKCPLCFPELEATDLGAEVPLFPTLDNYETPNLIFGTPNIRKIDSLEVNGAQRTFLEVFINKDGNPSSSHIRGHINVQGTSYLNFIRGNVFYDENRDEILESFDTYLTNFLKSQQNENPKTFVFITSESKHNSAFLDDISSREALAGKSVTVLRFQPSTEFVDNFISQYFKLLTGEDSILIFFEEVMSAAGTFKLVSDSIKHAKNRRDGTVGDIHDTSGFDLIFTLIDRMPPYTYDEVMGKLKCPKINRPCDRFISYFRLNVPVITAEHILSPISERDKFLREMVLGCLVDQLKLNAAEAISQNQQRKLPETYSASNEGNNDNDDIAASYFPFSSKSDRAAVQFEIYKPWFNGNMRNLLTLYITQELNDQIAELPQDTKLKLETIITEVTEIVRKTAPAFLVTTERKTDENRMEAIEADLVIDTIFKVLSRPPFTYYYDIQRQIFPLLLNELEGKFKESLGANAIEEFRRFRDLKFYVNRSIGMGSNFIISERFLELFRRHYSSPKWTGDIERFKALRENFNESGNNSADSFGAWNRSLDYLIKQIETAGSALLFYYKELTLKRPAKSIRLEQVLNSTNVLPKRVLAGDVTLKNLLIDPYYHFWGTLKAENIGILNDLKEWHKRNATAEDSLELLKTKYFGSESYRSVEQVIRNASKLLDCSRHKDNPSKLDEVKTATGQMLMASAAINSRLNPIFGTPTPDTENSLTKEIQVIFDDVVKILSANMEEVEYTLFVEFRPQNPNVPNFDNICSITSSETDGRPSSIKLSHQGFVYNMLYGLKTDPNSSNQHSVLAAAKIEGEFVCFNDEFYSPTFSSVPQKFGQLLSKDLNVSEESSGIPQLIDANMALFIRLAEFLPDSCRQNEDCLRGRAILLVTSKKNATVENFTNLFQIEKLRLLLLLKEDLLKFINREFDNEAFIDIVQKRKQIRSRDSLRHGLERYLDNLDRAKEEYFESNDEATKDDLNRLYDFVRTAIKHQLERFSGKITSIHGSEYYSNDVLREMVRIFFEYPICGRRIERDSYEFHYTAADDILLPISIFKAVIPELLVNMKEKGPRVSDKYRITVSNDSVTFENETKREPFFKKELGGLEMCRSFCDENGWKLIATFDESKMFVKVELIRND